MNEWWNEKPLADLSVEQWELLCDGCAKCCLHKFEDADSGEVFYTGVHCRLLDSHKCRCTDYAQRTRLVSECLALRQVDPMDLAWLPRTCAYRLRGEGRPLPEWHPLQSGSAESVHRAGISVRGRAISDEYVHPDGYDEHIVNWVE